MAKAVVPVAAFRERFGALAGPDLSEWLLQMVVQFLHEHQPAEKRKEGTRG
jgi:hypothetical protein